MWVRLSMSGKVCFCALGISFQIAIPLSIATSNNCKGLKHWFWLVWAKTGPVQAGHAKVCGWHFFLIIKVESMGWGTSILNDCCHGKSSIYYLIWLADEIKWSYFYLWMQRDYNNITHRELAYVCAAPMFQRKFWVPHTVRLARHSRSRRNTKFSPPTSSN
jgi:hypothetical protein